MASSSSTLSSSSLASRRMGTPGKGVSLAKKRRAAAAAKYNKVTLEKVLGMSCHNPNGLATSDSYTAYPAGCVAVLQDLRKKNKQIHIINKKSVSCVCFSPDGNMLATGEYGLEPCARVWELKAGAATLFVALKAHGFGIQCVGFSTGQTYLVSIGYRHDRQVIVWNWKSGTQVAYGKFGQLVNSFSWSEDHTSRSGANYFVTAHPRRIQFWYFDSPKPSKDGGKNIAATTILKARSAILGDLQDNEFVDVACGFGALSTNTYALSKSGKLCLFDNFRLLEKFTEIKASPARCLVISESYLFCGCSEGVIRLFDPYSLDYIITLPYPHPLGVDISAPVVSEPETLQYPDTTALAIGNNKLSVVYNDHSLYVWDVSNVKQVGKSRSFLFHSACVWDICTYPVLEDDSKQLLPDSCFVTCSSDNTVRFWCLDPNTDQWNIRNIYSKELIRIIYNEVRDYTFLKDPSLLPGDASAVADSSRGIRSIAVHCNGQHLAVGDREGNLRIYDLQFMDKIYEEVAHDSEILCLDYSAEGDGIDFLATASRDRMIHIFSNVENTYQPIQSLPDHSAAVTAVGFTGNKDKLQLLSAGADKSILFHAVDKDEDGAPELIRFHQVASKASIYDFTIDSLQKYFLTAGQDKFIRMYGVASGKKHTVIKVPSSDEGSVIKVTLDPSGLYVAASITDKSVLLFDVYMGDCIAKICGHSEVVTQLKFSRDCKYLYTVSGDSCIFVWKIWRELTRAMHERLAEINQPITSPLTPRKLSQTAEDEADEGVAMKPDMIEDQGLLDEQVMLLEPGQPDFDFRLSMLPAWARKAAMARPSVAPAKYKGGESSDSPAGSRMAEGRWAERLTRSELTFAVASDINPEELYADTEEVIKSRENKSVSAPIVIDLTGDAPEEITAESPEFSITDSPPSGESDTEGDIFYHPSTSHLDIDPSMFCVTTPTKPNPDLVDLDEDDVESSSETPTTSPPGKIAEGTHFIEANYQSLEKMDASGADHDSKLRAVSSRLSMSAKFLKRRSELQLLAAEYVNSASPKLADDGEVVKEKVPRRAQAEAIKATTAQSEALQAEAVQSEKTQESDVSPVSKSPASKSPVPKIRGKEKNDATNMPPDRTRAKPNKKTGLSDVSPNARVDGKEKNITTSVPPRAKPNKKTGFSEVSPTARVEGKEKSIATNVPPKKTTRVKPNKEPDLLETTEPIRVRRNSFEQDVTETKKRLHNLGYNIMAAPLKKGAGLDKPNERESEPQDLQVSAGAKTLEGAKRDGHGSGIKKAKEIEAVAQAGVGKEEKMLSSGYASCASSEVSGRKSLTTRSGEVLGNLETNFKALMALNAEALKHNDSTAIGVISRGTTTHKDKIVNWSNKNRKLWRKKSKGGGASGATPGPSSVSTASVVTCQSRREDEVNTSVDTPVRATAGLGPKEMQDANDLIDQLKKILSFDRC